MILPFFLMFPVVLFLELPVMFGEKDDKIVPIGFGVETGMFHQFAQLHKILYAQGKPLQ
tara:strand:- start:8344 stop:8520 length:177 start_codon:yes stop_codon:yes gene_type:complete